CCIEILFRNVVDQLDSNTPSSIHYWRYHTFWGAFAAFYAGVFAGGMFLAYYEKKSRQDNQIPGDAITNFFSIIARTSRVISPIFLFLLCVSWYHHFGGYSYPKSSLIDYLSIASAAWLAYELAKISPNAVSRSVIFQISLGSYEFLILHASLLLAPVFTIIQDNVSAVRSAYLIVCILLASALRLMSVWISKAIGNFTRMFLNIQKNRGATP
ncbi:MAG: hypothetical protein KDK27_01660, partial [Leptospiraceae bacterium]|nr:hypothetical protein [Leptospiraceae bacterium]